MESELSVRTSGRTAEDVDDVRDLLNRCSRSPEMDARLPCERGNDADIPGPSPAAPPAAAMLPSRAVMPDIPKPRPNIETGLRVNGSVRPADERRRPLRSVDDDGG
jgi:hypothetical protein